MGTARHTRMYSPHDGAQKRRRNQDFVIAVSHGKLHRDLSLGVNTCLTSVGTQVSQVLHRCLRKPDNEIKGGKTVRTGGKRGKSQKTLACKSVRGERQGAHSTGCRQERTQSIRSREDGGEEGCSLPLPKKCGKRGGGVRAPELGQSRCGRPGSAAGKEEVSHRRTLAESPDPLRNVLGGGQRRWERGLGAVRDDGRQPGVPFCISSAAPPHVGSLNQKRGAGGGARDASG